MVLCRRMQLGLFSAGVDYRYVNVVGGVLVGEREDEG